MARCARCKTQVKTKLLSDVIVCKHCFGGMTKGMGFEEYMGVPYNPLPIKYPAGYGTADDYPI